MKLYFFCKLTNFLSIFLFRGFIGIGRLSWEDIKLGVGVALLIVFILVVTSLNKHEKGNTNDDDKY